MESEGRLPKVIWFSRLKPDADPEAYERWVEHVDYPGARQVPSIKSYQVFRVEGPVVGKAAKRFDYDYVEVVEVVDLPSYLRDLDEHPAAQAIIAQIGQYIESVDSAWGHPVPR